MTHAEKIRRALKRDAVLMPGVYDALTARIANQVGFEIIFITGYSVSATALGEPDFGLLSLGDIAEATRRVCRNSKAPVIVDADTGYGNALNVQHTVRTLLDAGAAGIFLEDQLWPKRCGHMRGKKVIPAEEHANKIRAARDAAKESGRDLFIVARTDARQPLGLDAAIERCKLYKKAGADALFVEAPVSVEELRRIGRELPPPLVANMIERGVTPQLTRKELKKFGFQMIVCPLAALYASAKAVTDVYRILKTKGTTRNDLSRVLTFDEFNRIIGLQAKYDAEKRYAAE
ncbi:MAG: isocitrate lyase/PEP mutase family protein [Verrucomicrobia bacterium]|nr:isocitrate lyase/PEP mutase family protein [Verrucomicrobiota bacterium]